jgi:hypothetical protein
MGWDQIKARVISHKGKSAVLAIFLLVVFVPPLFQLILPAIRSKIIQISAFYVAKDDDAFFRKYISLLKKQDLEDAYAMMTEQARAAISSSVVQGIMPVFVDTTDKMEIVGVSLKSTRSLTNSNTVNKTDYIVDYEVKGTDPHKYMLVKITAEKKGEQLGITGFQAGWRNFSVREIDSGLDLQSEWFNLPLAIAIPLLVGYSALDYLAIGANPGWLSFLAIIFLNVYISMAERTTTFSFGFFNFASLAQPESWALLIPLPIGAIYYWVILRGQSKNWPISC